MKIRNRKVIRLCAKILAAMFRLLFATTRVRLRCGQQGPVPYGDWGSERFLMCMWHDAIAGTIFGGRSDNLAALVSRHADGGYVAEALNVLKIVPIRGSSGSSGTIAMREMSESAAHNHIAIATDGPRGPRHQVKDGILFLASITGRGIVPVVFACRSGWRIKGSWTDLLIPKPFTTVWLVSDDPMYLPPNLSRSELAPYREELQQRMDALNARAEAYARGELPDSSEPIVFTSRRDTPVDAAAPQPLETRAA